MKQHKIIKKTIKQTKCFDNILFTSNIFHTTSSLISNASDLFVCLLVAVVLSPMCCHTGMSSPRHKT